MNHAGRNCRDLVAAISDYIDGELTAARCSDLESHLHDCPCCDRFADSLKRAVAVCRAAGQTRLPATVQRRARARIAALLNGLPAECGPSAAPPKGRTARRGASSRAADAAKRGASASNRVRPPAKRAR